jgi:uncharacterized protein YndB with AHSA1/START domain
MTTKGSEKLSLEIKRPIKAPRDRVYAAWTDPGQLKKSPFGGFLFRGKTRSQAPDKSGIMELRFSGTCGVTRAKTHHSLKSPACSCVAITLPASS